ncbi:MAG TPA: response regulator transcription factor [Gemmatimonadaceae bacterium]|jgi:two-component system KDP operon response regulator KdpE|nr:response regulator transcription factor [Gemmatimonadaceae bacterium]
MMSPSILIVDDDPPIRQAARHALAPLGRPMLEAATGRSAIDAVVTVHPALIVLDLSLPDIDGLEVCREIRRTSSSPIIVLSARHTDDEKVRLLDAGADDYMTKPFNPAELIARARVHLRRDATILSAGPKLVRSGDLVIDFVQRTVTRAATPIRLTPIEWNLLRVLASQAGRVLTHGQIFTAAWGKEYGNAEGSLRVYVTKLRRKIESDPGRPTVIITEAGVGYRFVASES